MKTSDESYPVKFVAVRKRFLTDYEYVCGSEEVKSYIKSIGRKRGKYRIFDDPVFDILLD